MTLLNAGINLGFGFTKVATDLGEFRYASVVRELAQANPLAAPTPAQKVRYDGHHFEVGEDAALYGGGLQLKALHRDWATTLAYKVLAQSVVDRLSTDADQLNVVVGLALDHYKQAPYRRRVQAFWQRTWTTRRGDVDVVRATVVPEPMGAARVLTVDPTFHDVITNGDVLLVDFGRLTTNWLRLRRGHPVPEQSGSVDCSVTAALGKATERLSHELSRPQLDPVDVEMAWLDRAMLLTRDQPRRPVNVDDAIRLAARRIWPGIEQALKNAVDTRGLDVIVVGGGARLFQDLLTESLSEASVSVPATDTQMINCRGFLKMAAPVRSRKAAVDGAAASVG